MTFLYGFLTGTVVTAIVAVLFHVKIVAEYNKVQTTVKADVAKIKRKL